MTLKKQIDATVFTVEFKSVRSEKTYNIGKKNARVFIHISFKNLYNIENFRLSRWEILFVPIIFSSLSGFHHVK